MKAIKLILNDEISEKNLFFITSYLFQRWNEYVVKVRENKGSDRWVAVDTRTEKPLFVIDIVEKKTQFSVYICPVLSNLEEEDDLDNR